MTRVLIIGGDAAGMSAAAQATRGALRPELVVLERGWYTSYAACGLPYFVGGLVSDAADLVARTPEEHRANGIDVRLGHEVMAIDTDRRVVEVLADGDSDTHPEPFDELVIATGASPIRPKLPNIDARGIMGIQTIPHALAIDEIVRTRRPRRAVVVGGGYIGLEMVEALRGRGLEVTLVEKLAQPMATLDPDMAAHVTTAIEALGVDLRLNTGVEGFVRGEDGWVTAVATDAGEVEAELVVLGLGVRPNVGLARDAGIDIGPSGAIATDERMATSVDGVWAAGDCVESRHRVSRERVSIALGTHANKQGRVVGINVSGGDATFPGVIGTAITKVGEVEIARTGLNEREAAAAGFEVRVAMIDGTVRPGYYPGAAPVTIKVVTDAASGRLLGAQIVGGPGAGKRIDALAVAVWTEMTAGDFAQLDLAYAPPFSPVWDPSLVAARVASRPTG